MTAVARDTGQTVLRGVAIGLAVFALWISAIIYLVIWAPAFFGHPVGLVWFHPLWLFGWPVSMVFDLASIVVALNGLVAAERGARAPWVWIMSAAAATLVFAPLLLWFVHP